MPKDKTIKQQTQLFITKRLLTGCLLCADRVHISVVLQLGGDDEYVTLCDSRQTHEDQTSCHHGTSTTYYTINIHCASSFIILHFYLRTTLYVIC